MKFSVIINGKNEELKIVGSFGSIKFNGQNVRMLNDIYDHYNISPIYNVVQVQLTDKSALNKFKNEFESAIPDSLVQEGLGNYQDLLRNMTFLLPTCATLIIILMTVFTLINLLNIISIIILEKKRNIGIHKALGFSENSIKIRYMIRIIMLSFAGIILGYVLRQLLSRRMLNMFNCPNAIVFSDLKILIFSLFLIIIVTLCTDKFLEENS